LLAAWSGEAPGRTSVEVAVDDHAVAVDATCDGTGTLIVVASPASSASAAATSPSATFPCTDDRTATQLTLDRVAAGRVTFTAYLVEGFGATRPSTFAVSVERAD
jgi:hypothetical protein